MVNDESVVPGYHLPVEQEWKGIQPEVQITIYHLTENKGMQNSGDSPFGQHEEHLQNEMPYHQKHYCQLTVQHTNEIKSYLTF